MPTIPGGLRVSRQHTERRALVLKDPKVPLIKRQHICRPMTLREHDDRRVGQADSEMGMPLTELACKSDVRRGHERQGIDAALKLTHAGETRPT